MGKLASASTLRHAKIMGRQRCSQNVWLRSEMLGWSYREGELPPSSEASTNDAYNAYNVPIALPRVMLRRLITHTRQVDLCRSLTKDRLFVSARAEHAPDVVRLTRHSNSSYGGRLMWCTGT